MRCKRQVFVLLCLFLGQQMHAANNILVAGDQEKIWMPAYLNALSPAKHLNAYLDDGKGRAVLPGQFFDFGHQVKSLNQVLVSLIFSDRCQAVLQASGSIRLSRLTWLNQESPHSLQFDSGWVFIACEDVFIFDTKQGRIALQGFTGWLQVLTNKVSVYMTQGALQLLTKESSGIGQANSLKDSGRYQIVNNKIVGPDSMDGLDIGKIVPWALQSFNVEISDEKRRKNDLETYKNARIQWWRKK
jgi:hypothetical protein